MDLLHTPLHHVKFDEVFLHMQKIPIKFAVETPQFQLENPQIIYKLFYHVKFHIGFLHIACAEDPHQILQSAHEKFHMDLLHMITP